ncbi:MAG: flagellar basal body-associated FliL family protein [Dehalococcoidia bacterium]
MPKKPILFAGVAAVALLAAGWFFVLPMVRGNAAGQAAEDDEPVATAPAKKKSKRPAEPGLMYPMPDRVLNLTSSGGVPRYARIELMIEFEKPHDEKSAKKGEKKEEGGHAPAKGAAAPLDPALDPVVARKAALDDALVRVVGSKTAEEMTTAEGREAVKRELLAAVEEIVPAPAPLSVYIVRLVVQ